MNNVNSYYVLQYSVDQFKEALTKALSRRAEIQAAWAQQHPPLLLPDDVDDSLDLAYDSDWDEDM